MPYIAEKFEDFLAAASLGQDLTESAVGALRSSFYAGATILFFGVMGQLSPGPECNPIDEIFMTALFEELQAYARELRGRGESLNVN